MLQSHAPRRPPPHLGQTLPDSPPLRHPKRPHLEVQAAQERQERAKQTSLHPTAAAAAAAAAQAVAVAVTAGSRGC
jgi:hypothetical protein